MDFGIALATAADSWRVAQRAEELGFTHAWFYEEQLQETDHTISEIVSSLKPKPYSSREIIEEMGKYLAHEKARTARSRLSGSPTSKTCRSSAGVHRLLGRLRPGPTSRPDEGGQPYLTIDSTPTSAS